MIKKFSSSLITLLLAITILFVGCKTATSPDQVNLKFHFNNSKIEFENVNKGAKASDSQIYKRPYNSEFYTLEGWYTDYKLSLDTKISDNYILKNNEDLYIKVVPTIKNVTLSSPNKLVIDLPNYNFSDSELLNICVKCVLTSNNKSSLLKITNKLLKDGKYYLDFVLPTYIENNEYSIYVTNGVTNFKVENSKSPIIGNIPVPLNLDAKLIDCGVYDVSWENMGPNFKYELCYKISGKQLTPYAVVSENHCRFLTSETKDITFYVRTILKKDETQTSNYSNGYTVPFNKKDVDVLMLQYLDGDNDASSYLRTFLDDMEDALTLTSDKVEIITLWDGNDEKQGDSKLYKMGASNNEPRGILSSNTIDVTSTMNSSVWHAINGKVEANMGNPETLKTFIDWAKNHYNYKKIIIEFTDTGNNSLHLKCNETSKNHRGMSLDYSSNNYLPTSTVPKAIKEANIKFDLIIMSISMSGCIEETYEYKDVADYFLASPNNFIGEGINQKLLISHLRENDCLKNGVLDVEKLMNKTIKDYSDNAKRDNDFWFEVKNEYLQRFPDKKELDLLTNEGKIKLSEYALPVLRTLTGIKLSEIRNTTEKLQSLVKFALLPSNIEGFKNLKEIFNENTYLSNYSMISIGKLIDNICSTTNTWEDIKPYAENLKLALDKLIITSWADGYTKPLYSKIDCKIFGLYDARYYGLTIAEGKNTDDEIGLTYLDNNYCENLSFAKETDWSRFIYNILNLK